MTGKTIAFFNGYFSPAVGGIEQYTYQLGQELVARGYRVLVITSQYTQSLATEDEVDGIKVYRLPTYHIKHRYPMLRKNVLYREILGKIKEEDIDGFICNTRFHPISLLGARLAKQKGRKALVIEHGTRYLTLGNPFLDIFLKWVERYLTKKIKRDTDVFYGVSKEAATWLRNFDIKAKGVLYNAINREDLNKFPPKVGQDGKIRLIYVGRLIPKIKGIEQVLSVFSELSQRFDQLELLIVGHGPLYGRLQEKYRGEGINFLGQVSHADVMRLVGQTDVFILMSKIEGFSTALLEAGLMENVLVTTSVGGAHELIPTKAYGFVIEDRWQALYSTLEEILLHPDRMQAMKERLSKRILTRFTWRQTTSAFEQALLELEDQEIEK